MLFADAGDPTEPTLPLFPFETQMRKSLWLQEN
jgi:hypothetical protein